ncbi:hypothetical protein JL721_6145 [Aureococcus anophagefferens]|nr:hypothetical protein JL721_6145 [Aureococcus anophagefferens]
MGAGRPRPAAFHAHFADVPDDDAAVARHRHQRRETPGEGQFGRCYRCALRDDPSQKFAVKVVPMRVAASCDLEGGELFDRLLDKVIYSEHDARQVVLVMLEACSWLHGRGLCHRDFKPENLILASKDDDTTIHLVDFGLAAHVDDERAMKSQCGTPQFLAPEIVEGTPPYGPKTDCWAVGARLDDIRRNNWKFDPVTFDHVSDEAKDLIAKLMTKDLVSLKRAESLKKGFGGKAQVASGVDTELINMSPRFEKEIGADVAAAGPEHYYGSDQSSFYSFEDVLAGDEVEARYRDLHELEATEEDGASLDESDPCGRHAAVEEDKYDHPQAIGDEAAAEKHPLRRRIDGLHLPRLQVADAADGPQFSARSLFLAECVDKDLQPRAGFLLRKMRSTEINMAQLGVGERLARAFACCVGKLPNLLHLDMSYNYLGDRTMAEADCAIEELETADCHLDDDDVALFLERALRNRNLVLSRWNLAKNSIGAAVDHAPAASDRPSLASWIGSDECTCKRLDISWNMIRGSVAVALGKALSTNHCVTHLNLAFNSLAEEGVVFGNSLLKNRVLKVLDLSNNGLGPKAAFAMSVALLGRMSALELLVMDGNPVGVTGGQALLRVLTRMDHRAHLSLRDCSFHGGSIGERWIINDDYTLDLSVPILYCLARDILQGDATRPCPPIDCCYLTPPGGASQRIRTKIEWTGARARPSTGDAYDEAHSRALDNVVTRLASLDRDELLDFFPHRDGDDVPFLYRRELDALLEHLGLVEYVTERTADGSGFARTPRHALADTLPLVDNWSQLKATGRLEIGEFMQVAGRTRDDAGGRFVVFDEATGEDFAQTLPEAGVLRLCFAKAVVKLGMDEPMTQAGVVGWATSLGAIQDVLQVAEAADNHLLVLQMALPSLVLGHDTAARLFPALVAELLDPVAAIAKLLPRMASPLHVQAFIRAMLPKSTNRSRLQRAMGQRFQLLIDMPAGHYTLRLDKMEEREVLVALLQANRFERHRVVARAKRSLESGAFDENCFHYPYVDTSQHGNRSGFRNETLDGSAVEICDELLDGLGPSPKGLLEFDFVKMTRPPRTAEPMTRAHFSQLLSVAAISDDVDDRCLQLAVARPPGRPPGGEAAEDDGDKAAQDSLMEAQQKLAQAMPDVGKGGAAGGDHRRSTYKPRMQSINAVSQDTAERFKS